MRDGTGGCSSLAAVLTAALLLGCVGSESTVCYGEVCPPGASCNDQYQRCLLAGQDTVCESRPELESCTFEGSGAGYRCVGGLCVLSYCGDGERTTDEACDDGDGNSDTQPGACRTDCTLPRCGDQVRDGVEECDDEDHGGATCLTRGYTDGTLSCGPACTLDESRCFTCGDGQCETERGESRSACAADCDGWRAVSAGGSHTCAIRRDGTVWCWGDGVDGQLGAGSEDDSLVPVQVWNLEGAVQLDCGHNQCCAALSDGTAWCWGSGTLGDGSLGRQLAPVNVAVSCLVAEISASRDHSCVACQDGSAWCWGRNDDGQLGNGGTTTTTLPVQVSALTQVLEISAGVDHTCALESSGQVWCWGRDAFGQVGSDATSDTTAPVAVSGLGDGAAVSAGASVSFAVRQNGDLWGWGVGTEGKLGIGVDGWVQRTTPVSIDALAVAVEVSSGGNTTCAIASGGGWCWGHGDEGQLGNGTFVDANAPTAVDTSGSFRTLSVGGFGNHVCALDDQHRIWCWGRNQSGQVGTGDLENRSTPQLLAY